MKVKDFLNTCEHFNNVTIREITSNDCAFDPDEEYIELLTTDDIRNISDKTLEQSVELWYMAEDNIILYV